MRIKHDPVLLRYCDERKAEFPGIKTGLTKLPSRFIMMSIDAYRLIMVNPDGRA